MHSIVDEGKDSGGSTVASVKKMVLTTCMKSAPNGAIVSYVTVRGITHICAHAHIMGARPVSVMWMMAIAISAVAAPSQASCVMGSWTMHITTMAWTITKARRSGRRMMQRTPVSKCGGGGTTA
jgi:hypothetical protein